MAITSDAETWLESAPWRDRAVSLILISDDHRTVLDAHTLDGKRDLLAVVPTAGTILATWHGQWRTDTRVITPAQRKVVKDALR